MSLNKVSNVFRINFSHADYEDVAERIKMIRELNEEFGFTAAILADLQCREFSPRCYGR